MKLGYIFLLILSIFIASVSQILLKKGAISDYKNIYINKFSLSGYFILLFSTLLTRIAYGNINLSYGLLLESLSFIFVPTMSYLFLKENVNIKTRFGMIIIIIGVIIYTL